MYGKNTRIQGVITLALLSASAAVAADSRKPDFAPAPTVPIVRAVTRATVFVPVRQGASMRLTEQTVSVPAGADPRVVALDYLARPGGVLPKGTRVRSIYQEDGVVHIDFTPQIARFAGGSTAEALLLDALSATVAQFNGAKAFLLSVHNQPLAQLGGHVDLSEPYPVSKELPEDFR